VEEIVAECIVPEEPLDESSVDDELTVFDSDLEVVMEVPTPKSCISEHSAVEPVSLESPEVSPGSATVQQSEGQLPQSSGKNQTVAMKAHRLHSDGHSYENIAKELFVPIISVGSLVKMGGLLDSAETTPLPPKVYLLNVEKEASEN
jgi:hypothetical protein